MARIKVKVDRGNGLTQVITVDTEATKGATLGKDLYLPNGQLADPAGFLKWVGAIPPNTSGGGGGGSSGGGGGPPLNTILTTKGDLVTRDAQVQRLGIGTAGQLLGVAAGLPAWLTVNAASIPVDPAAFRVLTSTTVQGAFAQTDYALQQTLSTGVRNGGALTGVGTNTVQVAAGNGVILDNTNPAAPTFINLTWVAQPLGPLANGYFYVSVDAAGVASVSTVPPTAAEFRTRIQLGRVAVAAGVISGTTSHLTPIQQPAVQIRDIWTALGIVKNGTAPQPSGANLFVRVSAGTIYSPGAGFQISVLEPHQLNFPVFDTAGADRFRLFTQAGPVGVDVATLPVANYDNGGVITAIPGANARSQIFTVFRFPSGFVRILYGQQFYNTLADAIAALVTYDPIVPAVLATDSVVIGYIIAQKNTTALNSATAFFVTTDKFGFKPGGAAVQGTLPATAITYDNSVSGLLATDVQAAIDALALGGGGLTQPQVLARTLGA